MADKRLNKLAKLLVNYSTEVKPGDLVFVSADEVCTPWATEVIKEATKAGAYVEYKLSSQEAREVQLKYSNDEQLRHGDLIMETILEKADVWLSAWGSRNTRAFTNMDSEILKKSQEGAKKWRRFYSDRMGSGELRWCGTQYPTQSDAQEASMSFSEYEDFVYGAGLLNLQCRHE